MRIDKFLSNLDYGSRTDIKKYLKAKRIKLNDKVIVDAKTNINPNIDKVFFDNQEVFYIEDICIALNKPKDYICSNIDELYPSLLNLLPDDLRRLDLKICGRLDYDTEGLVILTNNGQFVHQIISPNKNVYKKYYVEARNKIIHINKLEEGIEILDARSNPYTTSTAKVELINDHSCYISVKEGKFHQVKRMFEAIDNEVLYLKRLSVGKYTLPNDLSIGEYKIIKLEEII